MSASQWTTVRRGKTTSQNFFRGRTGRPVGGMDSAFPVSGWRQAQSTLPNRREPPSTRGFSRVLPQNKTYASVVRQGRPMTNVRFATQDTRFQGQRKAADPRLRELVRKMYAVIKVVHHLRNVATKQGKAEPRTISRMVEVLSSMIKPAFPSTETLDLITGNAKNWGYNTLLILEDHYTTMLQNILSDLSRELPQDWKAAFEVATRWAYRNFSRMIEDVIEHAEALIASCEEGPAAQAVTREDEQGEGREPTPPPSPPPLIHPQPQLSSHTRPQTERVQNTHAIHLTERNQGTHLKASTATVATMTDANLEWGDEGDRDQGAEFQGQPLAEETPQPSRRRRGRMNGCVALDDGFLTIVEEEPAPTRTHGGLVQGRSLLDGDQEARLDRTPPLVPSTTTVPQSGNQGANLVAVQVLHREDSSPIRGFSQGEEDSLVNLSAPDGASTSTPKPTFRAKKHISTLRKLVDWDVTVSRKWLVLGDSNVARFPTHLVADLQIDSYPGANFRHAQAILAKALIHTQVEKVVLAFGINCRAQRAKETAIKQLQSAVREAKKQFPYSEIWIPLINYSNLLPTGEQNTLQLINGHIRRNMPYIPLLPRDLFHTEADMIHWTRETAKAMLKHWSSFLGLSPQ
ncbi:F-box and leucine-rich repeat protein 13 [Sarotherodon galilaeus]